MWKQAILLGGCLFFATGLTRFLWLGSYFPFGGPLLECEAPEFDFGTAKVGESVRHVFRILNEGREELHIRQVRKDCGCTVAKLSAERLPPGGHADVTVEMSLDTLGGPVKKRVLLDTNDSRNPVSVLVIRGTVEADIHVEPRRFVVDLSEAESVRKEYEIDIYSDRGATFNVLEAYSNASCLDVRFESVVKGERYRVYVSKSARRFSDSGSHAMVFVRTDHRREPLLPIRVDIAQGSLAANADSRAD